MTPPVSHVFESEGAEVVCEGIICTLLIWEFKCGNLCFSLEMLHHNYGTALEPNANLFSHIPWLGNHRDWWRTAACQKPQEATRSCPHCATMGERGKQK